MQAQKKTLALFCMDRDGRADICLAKLHGTARQQKHGEERHNQTSATS